MQFFLIGFFTVCGNGGGVLNVLRANAASSSSSGFIF